VLLLPKAEQGLAGLLEFHGGLKRLLERGPTRHKTVVLQQDSPHRER
jgi:hypothetical protein